MLLNAPLPIRHPQHLHLTVSLEEDRVRVGADSSAAASGASSPATQFAVGLCDTALACSSVDGNGA